MYEIADAIIDLSAVNIIQWSGGTSSIVITTGFSSIYLTPEYKDTDDHEMSYDEVCKLRHSELVAEWKKIKSNNTPHS